MRALIWIEEASWEACVDKARELIPAGAELTLLHVSPADAEQLAAHPGPGRLGRHRPPPGLPIARISEAEARALLSSAAERIGRPAELVARRGRLEHEIVAAAAAADLLLLARNGDARPGPPSIGHRARFVVDHAPCDVILVWPEI